MGSFEDHGPGAPMGDYLLAEAIARRIAARATEAGTPCLLAPTLPFGGADWFGPVPGAIALAPATIRAVIHDMLAALLRHRCTRLIIVNGHGGNAAPIHEATLAIRQRDGVIIPSLYLWKIATAWLPPGNSGHTTGHTADPVLAIARHLFPDLCPPLAIPPTTAAPPPTLLGLPITGFGTATLDDAPIDLPLDYTDIAPTLTAATTANGATLTERLVTLGTKLATKLANTTTTRKE